MRDYSISLYDILEVSTDATADEIKKAYKKMVLKYHPDRCKDNDASEIFQRIYKANEILSDPIKRRNYDNPIIEEPNCQIQRDKTHKSSFFRTQNNSRVPIERITRLVTLIELFTQKTIILKIPRKIKCDTCKNVRNNCIRCNNTGMINSENEIEINIPKNILKENVVYAQGEGSWSPLYGYADLSIILTLDMNESKNFSLSLDNLLIYTIYINFAESVCGFKKLINHPSGKKICIVSDPGNIINPDTQYILENLGLSESYFESNVSSLSQWYKYDIMPLFLQFIIFYPEPITIPNSKKMAFTCRNLEKILGGKLELDYEPTNEDNNCTYYNLKSLEKISKIKNQTDNNFPFDMFNFGKYSTSGTNNDTEQKNCTQQ